MSSSARDSLRTSSESLPAPAPGSVPGSVPRRAAAVGGYGMAAAHTSAAGDAVVPPSPEPSSPFLGMLTSVSSPRTQAAGMVRLNRLLGLVVSISSSSSSLAADPDVVEKVAWVRMERTRLEGLVGSAEHMMMTFTNLVACQKNLSDHFSVGMSTSHALVLEYQKNAETQSRLAANGLVLMQALDHFVSSVKVLSGTTLPDMLQTCIQLEEAHDEWRRAVEIAELLAKTPDDKRGALQISSYFPFSRQSQVTSAHAKAASEMERLEDAYRRKRFDFLEKFDLVKDNSEDVMRKMLFLCQNATSLYFTSNGEILEMLTRQPKSRAVAHQVSV